MAQRDPSSYSSSFQVRVQGIRMLLTRQPVIYKDALNFFPHLPPELILYIFKYLLLHDLAQAAQVRTLSRVNLTDTGLSALEGCCIRLLSLSLGGLLSLPQNCR